MLLIVQLRISMQIPIFRNIIRKWKLDGKLFYLHTCCRKQIYANLKFSFFKYFKNLILFHQKMKCNCILYIFVYYVNLIRFCTPTCSTNIVYKNPWLTSRSSYIIPRNCKKIKFIVSLYFVSVFPSRYQIISRTCREKIIKSKWVQCYLTMKIH